MPRDIAAQTRPCKSVQGFYRVGRFLITRAMSRGHICARDTVTLENFSTLGGAMAWCRQRSESPLPVV
jgi:hypothetical protein